VIEITKEGILVYLETQKTSIVELFEEMTQAYNAEMFMIYSNAKGDYNYYTANKEKNVTFRYNIIGKETKLGALDKFENITNENILTNRFGKHLAKRFMELLMKEFIDVI